MSRAARTACGAALAIAASAAGLGCGPSPAYEPEAAVVPEPPNDPAWTPAPDDPALPFGMGQTWVGQYHCAQGDTDLALHIVDVDGPELRALFDFRHGPSGAAGLFEMAGRWSVREREVTFVPTRWLKRPEGYVTVSLRGRVSVGGRRFVGTVEGPGCTGFMLRLLR
ncbi:MAG TPA: hypothetical protein VHB21_11000 [Minicystis sp.]|nr:hypothetical protein [Minicystis sp.]